MKMKEKIMEYFRTYWRRGRFMKAVSLTVLVCFMINIIQPAAVFGSTDDDLRNKTLHGQNMVSGGVSGGASGPVNQQVDLGASDLSASMRKEMSKQNITVNLFGNVIDKAKGADKPIGSIDDKGKVIATFDKNGAAENDRDKKNDLQSRVDQFFEAGGVRGGGFKTTVSEEFRDAKTESRNEEQKQAKDKDDEEKSEDMGEMEGNISVDEKVEESVQAEKTEVVKSENVNEQSVDEKKDKLQKALAKKKDSTSVTIATIEKVQETGSKVGKELIAVRNPEDGIEQIALYQNESGTENIYVGISEGLMMYADHSGSVNVGDYSSLIEMEGNTYKKTEIALVLGNQANEDKSVNKRISGLFAPDMLDMVTKEGVLASEKKEERKGVAAKIGETIAKAASEIKDAAKEIKEKKKEIRQNILKETAEVFDNTNRNILAIQPVVAEIAVKKGYKRTGEETIPKASAEEVKKMLEAYGREPAESSPYKTRPQENASGSETEVKENAAETAKEAEETANTSQAQIISETKSGYSSYIYQNRLAKGGKRGSFFGGISRLMSKRVEEIEAEKKAIELGKEEGLSEKEVKDLLNKARKDGVSAQGVLALLNKAKEEGVSLRDLYGTLMGDGARAVSGRKGGQIQSVFRRAGGGIGIRIADEGVDLKDVMKALDEGMSVKDLVKASKAAKASGTSLSALMRNIGGAGIGFSMLGNRIGIIGDKGLGDVVSLVNMAKEEGMDIKQVGSLLRQAGRQGVSASDLLKFMVKAKEEGISFKEAANRLMRRGGKGFLSRRKNIKAAVEAVKKGKSVKEALGITRPAAGSGSGVAVSMDDGKVEIKKGGVHIKSDVQKDRKTSAQNKDGVDKSVDADGSKSKTDKPVSEINKSEIAVAESEESKPEAAQTRPSEKKKLATTGDVINRTSELFKQMQASENPENDQAMTAAIGIKAAKQVFKEIDEAYGDKGLAESVKDAFKEGLEEASYEQKLSESAQGKAFLETREEIRKIAGKIDGISEEDKKAISEAKNMDELKAAVNGLKEKNSLFAALLLAVIAKGEQKLSLSGIFKKANLSLTKKEFFEAIYGKGKKGALARLMSALGLSAGFFLTAKDMKMIGKAKSLDELKAFVNKLEKKKGFFGKFWGKITAAKLKAVIAKAEAKEKEIKSEGEKGKTDGAESGEDDGYGGFDPELVNKLMEQTGLSKEEVVAQLTKTKEDSKKVDAEKGLPEGSTFNEAMARLKEFLDKGGSILNCAADAMFNYAAGAVAKGLLALQALCAEIAMGNFNETSIRDGQLHTSMAAQTEALSLHGIDASGYKVTMEDFINGMNPGDKAIIWVDENHFITVIKNEDGTFDIIDPNKNNGKAMTFSAQEMHTLLSGGAAHTTDGTSVQGYTKVTDANGQMRVLSDSKGVSERGQKISQIDLKNIKGAKGNPFKAIGKAFKSVGKAIGKAFKAVGKAFKAVGKWISKNWKKIVAAVAVVVAVVAVVALTVFTFGAGLAALAGVAGAIGLSGAAASVAAVGMATAIVGAGVAAAGYGLAAVGKMTGQKWLQKVGGTMAGVGMIAMVAGVAITAGAFMMGAAGALAAKAGVAVTGSVGLGTGAGVSMGTIASSVVAGTVYSGMMSAATAVVYGAMYLAGSAMKSMGKEYNIGWMEKAGNMMEAMGKAGLKQVVANGLTIGINTPFFSIGFSVGYDIDNGGMTIGMNSSFQAGPVSLGYRYSRNTVTGENKHGFNLGFSSGSDVGKAIDFNLGINYSSKNGMSFNYGLSVDKTFNYSLSVDEKGEMTFGLGVERDGFTAGINYNTETGMSYYVGYMNRSEGDRHFRNQYGVTFSYTPSSKTIGVDLNGRFGGYNQGLSIHYNAKDGSTTISLSGGANDGSGKWFDNAFGYSLSATVRKGEITSMSFGMTMADAAVSGAGVKFGATAVSDGRGGYQASSYYEKMKMRANPAMHTKTREKKDGRGLELVDGYGKVLATLDKSGELYTPQGIILGNFGAGLNSYQSSRILNAYGAGGNIAAAFNAALANGVQEIKEYDRSGKLIASAVKNENLDTLISGMSAYTIDVVQGVSPEIAASSALAAMTGVKAGTSKIYGIYNNGPGGFTGVVFDGETAYKNFAADNDGQSNLSRALHSEGVSRVLYGNGSGKIYGADKTKTGKTNLREFTSSLDQNGNSRIIQRWTEMNLSEDVKITDIAMIADKGLKLNKRSKQIVYTRDSANPASVGLSYYDAERKKVITYDFTLSENMIESWNENISSGIFKANGAMSYEINDFKYSVVMDLSSIFGKEMDLGALNPDEMSKLTSRVFDEKTNRIVNIQNADGQTFTYRGVTLNKNGTVSELNSEGLGVKPSLSRQIWDEDKNGYTVKTYGEVDVKVSGGKLKVKSDLDSPSMAYSTQHFSFIIDPATGSRSAVCDNLSYYVPDGSSAIFNGQKITNNTGEIINFSANIGPDGKVNYTGEIPKFKDAKISYADSFGNVIDGQFSGSFEIKEIYNKDTGKTVSLSMGFSSDSTIKKQDNGRFNVQQGIASRGKTADNKSGENKTSERVGKSGLSSAGEAQAEGSGQAPASRSVYKVNETILGNDGSGYYDINAEILSLNFDGSFNLTGVGATALDGSQAKSLGIDGTLTGNLQMTANGWASAVKDGSEYILGATAKVSGIDKNGVRTETNYDAVGLLRNVRTKDGESETVTRVELGKNADGTAKYGYTTNVKVRADNNTKSALGWYARPNGVQAAKGGFVEFSVRYDAKGRPVMSGTANYTFGHNILSNETDGARFFEEYRFESVTDKQGKTSTTLAGRTMSYDNGAGSICPAMMIDSNRLLVADGSNFNMVSVNAANKANPLGGMTKIDTAKESTLLIEHPEIKYYYAYANIKVKDGMIDLGKPSNIQIYTGKDTGVKGWTDVFETTALSASDNIAFAKSGQAYVFDSNARIWKTIVDGDKIGEYTASYADVNGKNVCSLTTDLSGKYINEQTNSLKWSSGSLIVTMGSDGTGNPVIKRLYNNAVYNQSLAGTEVKPNAGPGDPLKGVKWQSGSITVTLNGDVNAPKQSTVYNNAVYTQNLKGTFVNKAKMPGVKWTGGSMTVILNGNADNPRQKIIYNNATYRQNLKGTFVNEAKMPGVKWTGGSMTVILNGNADNPRQKIIYDNATYRQNLKGTFVNKAKMPGVKWTGGSMTVILNGNADNPRQKIIYDNATYDQALAGTLIKPDAASGDPLKGIKWKSGSMTVTLNGDSDNVKQKVSYNNAIYEQKLTGDVDPKKAPGVKWESGKVVVTLNGDGSKPETEYVDAKYSAPLPDGTRAEVTLDKKGKPVGQPVIAGKPVINESTKTMSARKPYTHSAYHNDTGIGSEESGFTTTMWKFDKSGKEVKIDVVVKAQEQSYLIWTNSSQTVEIYVDGKLVDTASDSGSSWGWNGRASDAVKYAEGKLGEYKFTDKYTVNIEAYSGDLIPKGLTGGINTKTTATVVLPATAEFPDGTKLITETIEHRAALPDGGYVANAYVSRDGVAGKTDAAAPQVLSMTIRDVGIVPLNADAPNANLLLTNAKENIISFNYDINGNLESVSQYQAESFILNNKTEAMVIMPGGSTENVNGEIKGIPAGIGQGLGFISSTYEKNVGDYINSMNEADIPTITKTDITGKEHKIRPYYQTTPESKGEKVLFYDLKEQNRREILVIDDRNDRDPYQYTKTTEEYLSSKGYKKGVDYERCEYTDDRKFKLIYDDNLSDAKIIFNGNYDGNGDRKFTVDSIKFDQNKGFVVTAGVFMTDKIFKVTGDTSIGSGGGSAPSTTDKHLHQISASIDGDKLELTATGYNEGNDKSKAAISFGAGQLMQDTITGYSFDHFYAGTDLTFVKPSTITSTQDFTSDEANKNGRSISNSSADAGYLTNQSIGITAEAGSKVFLNKDTGLSQLASNIIESSQRTGTFNVTNEFTIGGSTYRMEKNIVGNQTWKEAAFVKGTDLQVQTAEGTWRNVEVGESLMGEGEYKGNGVINYGWWSGKMDLNESATNFEISKAWYARSVEAVGGFVSSVVGVVEGVVNSAIWVADGLINGLKFQNYGDFAWGVAKYDENGMLISGNEGLTIGAMGMFNKNYSQLTTKDTVKAAVGGAVAIAAVCIVVATGGLGLAAVVPALAAAEISGAALAASAAFTAYFASQAAMNAYDAFAAEGIGSVSGWFNVAACLLSVAFPMRVGGAVKATGTVAGNAAAQTAVKGGIKVFGRAVANGFKGAVSNVGAALGAQGIHGAITAWSGMAQHMYSMAKLNIAMNAIGGIFGSADEMFGWGVSNLASRNKDSFLGGVAVNILAAGQGNIFAMNPGQSLQFGLAMYVGMPIAQGIAGGIKAMFAPATNALTGAVEKTIIGKVLGRTQGLLAKAEGSALARIATGSFEEWFKEGALQHFILAPLGVKDELAEILVEFMSPNGAGVAYTNAEYANQINNIGNGSSSSTPGSNAVNFINNMFAMNGFANTSVAFDGSGFILSQNGRQIGDIIAASDIAQIQSFMAAIGAIAQVAGEGNFAASVDANIPVLMAGGMSIINAKQADAQNLMLAQRAALQSNSVNEGFIQNAYVAAENHGGFSTRHSAASQLWSNFRTGHDAPSLSVQARAEISALVARNSGADGKFDVRNIVDALNHENKQQSVQAVNDLITIITLSNSKVLNKTENGNFLFNNSTVVDAINGIKIDPSNNALNMQMLQNLAQIGAIASIYNNEAPALKNNEIADAAAAKMSEISSVVDNMADGQSVQFENEKLAGGGNTGYLSYINSDGNTVNLASFNINEELVAFAANAMILSSQSGSFSSKTLNAMLNSISAAAEQNIKAEETEQKERAEKIRTINEILSNKDDLSARKQAEAVNGLLNSEDADTRRLAALMLFNNRDMITTGFMTNQAMQDMAKAVLSGKSTMTDEGRLDSEYITGESIDSNYLTYINYDSAFNALAEAVTMAETETIKKKYGYEYRTGGDNLGQFGALLDALTGGSFAIYADVGFGKTIIADTMSWLRSYMGKADMDLILQNDSEVNNHLKNRWLMGQHGTTIYVMQEIVQSAQKEPNKIVDFNGEQITAIERFRRVMGDENAVRIWLDSEYGFGGTTAESQAVEGNSELKQIMQKHQDRTSRLTIADEAHKFMESTMSYVMSSGASTTLADDPEFTVERQKALVSLYDIAADLKKGVDFNIDPTNGQVVFTDKGKEKAEEAIKKQKIKDATTGKIKSMVQAMADKGSNKYMISDDIGLVGADAAGKLVTMSGGQAQPSMVLSDYSYAYSAAIQCLGEDTDKFKALARVRTSRTSYGTSRSRLFYGKGQYVAMSGTLSHVDKLSEVLGMPVVRFGTEKNFDFEATTVGEVSKKFNKQRLSLKAEIKNMEQEMAKSAADKKGVSIISRQLNLKKSMLEDTNAAIEILSKLSNLSAAQAVETLGEEMKNTKGSSAEMRALAMTYEALNTVEVVEFSARQGYIDADGNITDKGITRMAEDIIKDAGKGLNQLFVSLSDRTLNDLRVKIEELLKAEGKDFEICDINGTVGKDSIFSEDADGNKKGYIISSNDTTRIVLANERGGMGLDFTGNWSVKSDSSNAVYSFIHQTFGRSGRHMEKGERFTRTIYANMSEVNDLLTDVKTAGLYEWIKGNFTEKIVNGVDVNFEFSKYRIFDGIRTADDITTKMSLGKQILLAKMYKGLVQSSSALMFGMIDTLNDVGVTSALANLITAAENADNSVAAETIRKIQTDVFNNHTDGAMSVGRGELLDGKDQITNSLEQQREKAKKVFNTVMASLNSLGVAKNSELYKQAAAWTAAWENAAYNQQGSEAAAKNKEKIVSLDDANPATVQKAFDIIYARAQQIMPYFGSYQRESGVTTIEQVAKTLGNDSEFIEMLKAENSPYIVGNNLTYDGRVLFENYAKLTGKTETLANIYIDDEAAKALMQLLLQFFGVDFTSAGPGDKKSACQASKFMADNDIAIEKLINLSNYTGSFGVDLNKVPLEKVKVALTDLGIDLNGLSDVKIRDIFVKTVLNAEYDASVAANLRSAQPDAMLMKMIEFAGVDSSGKATAESLEAFMPSASKYTRASLVKIYNQFNKTYSQVKNSVYNKPLTAKEKIAARQAAFKKKYPVIVNSIESTKDLIINTLGFMVFKAPAFKILGSVFGASAHAAREAWQVSGFSDTLREAGAFMTLSILERVFKRDKITDAGAGEAKLGVSGTVAAAAVGITDAIAEIWNGISTRRNIGKLDKLVNVSMSDIAKESKEEIAMRLAIAGYSGAHINKGVSNFVWMMENMPGAQEALKDLKLSDIEKFEIFSSLTERAKKGELDISGIRAKEIIDIVKGKKSAGEVLDKGMILESYENGAVKSASKGEGERADYGNIKELKASQLDETAKYFDNKEELERMLSLAEEGGEVEKVREIAGRSGYVPVAVKDIAKVKELLKDANVALYMGISGKSVLFVSKDKAEEAEKSGKSEEKRFDDVTRAALEESGMKLAQLQAEKVGEKLLDKIVDGYANADELDRMVLVAVAAFASFEEMEEYLGVSFKEGKEGIAHAAVNKIGEAVYMGQQGSMSLEERDREISLIRTVSEILMACSGNARVKELVNTIKDEEGVRELQRLMPVEVKVNRYIVADAMSQAISIDNDVMRIGDFEIDLVEIKTELESREPKFNMFNKKNDELLDMISNGMRGQNAGIFTPMLNNMKAVAAAA